MVFEYLFYYTHFIKKERVNQWHTLEKEITDGNTASPTKPLTAHISKNQSQDTEPQGRGCSGGITG